MSHSLSANQYEIGFQPKRLLNWELPRTHKSMPDRRIGFTQFIGNDRGHILPTLGKRSTANPWGNFVGTWQLPARIPGPRCTVTTARDERRQTELRSHAERCSHVISGQVKNRERQRNKAASTMKPTYVKLPAITVAPVEKSDSSTKTSAGD